MLFSRARVRSSGVHSSTMTHGIVMKDRDTRRAGSSSATKGVQANGSERRHARTQPADVLSRYTLSPGTFSFPRARPFPVLYCLPAFVTRPPSHPSPSGFGQMNRIQGFNNFSPIIPILFARLSILLPVRCLTALQIYRFTDFYYNSRLHLLRGSTVSFYSHLGFKNSGLNWLFMNARYITRNKDMFT